MDSSRFSFEKDKDGFEEDNRRDRRRKDRHHNNNNNFSNERSGNVGSNNVVPITNNNNNNNNGEEHGLQHSWTFWYLRKSQGSRAIDTYEKNVKQVGSFSTVEGFWNFYSHMIRPNDLPPGNDYHLFKDGIKPMWEDEANKQGGKWVVRLKKGYGSRYWEEFLLAIIGEQFDVGEDLCGVIISIRYQEDIISIWNKDSTDEESRQKIHDRMKRILYSTNSNVSMDYKAHSSSITDYTTFQKSQNPGQGSPSAEIDAKLI
eukprot:TRINITY_DN737_c0_g1_i1.p1 TRINITY_DN737_c0_g1~~TRINITY_DN737_c0_g1_i1.p1  ORF type:complete len:296 (+),score=88.26 TRINITY_DN737_c0_g1_i1:114-890(+)